MTEGQFVENSQTFLNVIPSSFEAQVRCALDSGAIDLETANMDTVRAVVSAIFESIASDFKPMTKAGLKQRANLRHYI
jgi:hypothetical protein